MSVERFCAGDPDGRHVEVSSDGYVYYNEHGAKVVRSIVVKQDVGGPYPDYRYVALDCMNDGTVKWREPVAADFPTPETTPEQYR
jgi:hypothetical protein